MFQSCHHGPIHGSLGLLLLRVGTLALQGSQPEETPGGCPCEGQHHLRQIRQQQKNEAQKKQQGWTLVHDGEEFAAIRGGTLLTVQAHHQS